MKKISTIPNSLGDGQKTRISSTPGCPAGPPSKNLSDNLPKEKLQDKTAVDQNVIQNAYQKAPES